MIAPCVPSWGPFLHLTSSFPTSQRWGVDHVIVIVIVLLFCLIRGLLLLLVLVVVVTLVVTIVCGTPGSFGGLLVRVGCLTFAGVRCGSD